LCRCSSRDSKQITRISFVSIGSRHSTNPASSRILTAPVTVLLALLSPPPLVDSPVPENIPLLNEYRYDVVDHQQVNDTMEEVDLESSLDHFTAMRKVKGESNYRSWKTQFYIGLEDNVISTAKSFMVLLRVLWNLNTQALQTQMSTNVLKEVL
jgi:hypothetical protein